MGFNFNWIRFIIRNEIIFIFGTVAVIIVRSEFPEVKSDQEVEVKSEKSDKIWVQDKVQFEQRFALFEKLFSH